MIDNYAWNVFVNTGNIEAYLLSKETAEINSKTPDVCLNNAIDISLTVDSKVNTA